MSTDRHLSIDELATLAEGRDGVSGALQEHLERCPDCFAAYSEAVMSGGDYRQDPTRFPAPDEVLRAARRVPAVPDRPRPSPLRRIRTIWIGGSGVAMAAIVLMLLWPGQDRDPRMPPEVSELVSRVSVNGFPLPGATAPEEHPVYRTGDPGDLSALQELQDLDARYEEAPSAALAVWRSAGYLALGDVRTARAILGEARRRYPENVDLLVIKAAIEHRDGDPIGARAHIEAAISLDRDNDAALAARRFLTE